MKEVVKKWWFWVAVVLVIGGIGAAVSPKTENQTDTKENSVKEQMAEAEKKNEAYMDAMRKCTVMEAADIYTTGVGADSDNVFDDANKVCRKNYKDIYAGDDEKLIADIAKDWEARKDEAIEGKPLSHYLDILGW